MSSDKNLYSLDELGSVGRGRSRHRPRNDVSLYGGKYPFIQTGDIRKAEFYVTSYSQTYNEKGLAQSKLWDKGTLCITIAANIAETAILKIKACFPDSIIGFIADENKADVRFVKYCLETYKLQMQSISQGATQDNLSLEKLLSLKFKLPPLPLQTRIADLLSAYDELIEVNNRRIALLEQTAEQLYKEWFVRLRFPGYAQTKVRKGVPEGWEVKPLKFFGKIITGKTPSKKVEHFYGTKFPFYKTPDIHRGVFINSTEEALSDTGLKEISSNSIPENSIMISCIGTAGVVAISSSKGATNQQINSIIPNESVYREYLYFVAKGLKPRIEMFGATGSTMTNLSKGKLSKLVVLNPEKSIVNRFNQKTIAFFNQIQTLQTQNQTLRHTRDLLLPRLISGQLSVAEAETALNA
ncbi:restriction endonuclease subunit S [Phaeodactylibacter xiamenensis]|uniref:restriction endonuclease subunit S n=1 Tax=Phaeodactylibacter xiamenensis TaxID=1524460 RepID=UPI003BA9A72E